MAQNNTARKDASAPLQVDLAEAERHLALLDPEADDFIFFSGDDDKEREKRRRKKALLPGEHGRFPDHQYGSARQHLAWLNQRNQDECCIAVTVQHMDGRTRTKKALAGFRAVFAELDHGLPASSWPIEPSFIIESSPGRFHVYWLIDPSDPIALADFKSIMACLVASYRADPGATDEARPLRLAGTYNRKPGRPPFKARIVDEATTGARHGRTELVAAFPAPPPEPKLTTSQRAKAAMQWRKQGQAFRDLDYGLSPEEAAKRISPDCIQEADGSWTTLCPVKGHGKTGVDSSPSLRLTRKSDGGLLAKCWAGCKQPAIMDALVAFRVGLAAPRPSHTQSARPAGKPRVVHEAPPREANDNPDEDAGRFGAPPPDAPPNPLLVTQDSVATALVNDVGDDWAFCHDRKKWRFFDGAAWRLDERRRFLQLCREAARVSNIVGAKASIGSAQFAMGVETFARVDRRLSASSDQWDCNHFLLGTPAGTVDLRTGALRPANPKDYITKLTTVGPAAPGTPTPLFDAFLRDTTGNDHDFIGYLWRLFGYFLTGDTREEALPFFYGPGGNGKGTLIRTITGIMGEYAVSTGMETFVETKQPRHLTELAVLCGARLVTAEETQRSMRLNEGRIKQLTGRSKVTAQFMRCDPFNYDPTYKIGLLANHQPDLRSVDDAWKRRVNMIPCVRKPATVDTQLAEKLKPEWPAILRRAIDRCLEWQRIGLQPPQIVVAATSDFFETQDSFAQWVEECCTRAPDSSATRDTLYASYKEWMERNGQRPCNTKDFKAALVAIGCEYLKNTPNHHGRRGYLGIALKSCGADSEHDRWHQE